jgi:hypothetical protein
MLLKIHSNYFQYKPEEDRFLSYAPSTQAYSIGTWFKCGEKEVQWIRKKVLAGYAEVKVKLPGYTKIF